MIRGMDNKPGIKTSEFWLSAAAIAVPAIQYGAHATANPNIVWLSGIVAAIYTLARAYIKGVNGG